MIIHWKWCQYVVTPRANGLSYKAENYIEPQTFSGFVEIEEIAMKQ